MFLPLSYLSNFVNLLCSVDFSIALCQSTHKKENKKTYEHPQ